MESSDFADTTQLVSDLFLSPKGSSEWQKYALDSEQIQHFEERGFVSGIQVLDATQIDTLRDALDRMTSPSHPRHDRFYEYNSNESQDPSKVLFHALGAWRVEESFHDLLWAPALRMAAYQLLGATVRQFHDQLFCKPAKDGGVVAWHQDYSYWTWTRPLRHLTCWIALDDATCENGCLRYVPESHRWGLLPITGLAGDMESVRSVLDAEQEQQFSEQVAIELPAGYACFHHPLLMHGSLTNESERPRRAAVVNVIGDGAQFDRNAHPTGEFGNFPVGETGESVSGRFYPVLFDAKRELGDRIQEFPTADAY